ncbi:MAG: ABC transporter substrate-binding protein, partial [Crenarchaeota archaeon]|nr:ABC transporter substrate-binding protein [Thermoproteota archaeon]
MAKNNKLIIGIALIAIIAIALVSVGLFLQNQNNNNEPSPSVSPTSTNTATPSDIFPLILTDNEGNTITLNEYPEKIVSLAPAVTEILFAVGAGDNVIGITDYCDYPYNFAAWVESGNITSIGSYYKPAIEPIVALNPDLVVAARGSSDAANQLRDLGYTVLTLDPS